MTEARSSDARVFKNREIIFGRSTQPASSDRWMTCPAPSEATHDFTRMSNSPGDNINLIILDARSRLLGHQKYFDGRCEIDVNLLKKLLFR